MISKVVQSIIDPLKRVPAALWWKLGAFGAMMVAGLALLLFTPLGEYLDQERIIPLLEGALEDVRSSPYTPFLLIASFALVTPFGVIPVSPQVIAGAVIYGYAWGSVINISGLALGAMTAYWTAKVLGRDFVVQVAGARLKRAEKIFERQGFWALVQVRFLPIPFSLISYTAALTGVKTFRFLITTVIGLIPATLIHTYFTPKLILESNRGTTLVMYIASFVVLNIITTWPSIRQRLRRRERYRELMARRAARNRSV